MGEEKIEKLKVGVVENVGPGKVGAGESGPGEVGPGEVGPGESGPGEGGPGGTREREAGESGTSLIEKIRERRSAAANKPIQDPGGAGGIDPQNPEGIEGGQRGGAPGTKGNNRTAPGVNRSNGRNHSGAGKNNSGPNENAPGTSSQEIKESIKFQGFAGGKSSSFPKFEGLQIQNVLTDKEGKEYAEKMNSVFRTIFRYTDSGITATNRDKAQAVIWSDIDDEDIGVLIEVTIGGAKKSRIVATAVRQVSKAHNLLRLGIITGPRFMQTVKFYSDHGGFVLPFGGNQNEIINQ